MKKYLFLMCLMSFLGFLNHPSYAKSNAPLFHASENKETSPVKEDSITGNQIVHFAGGAFAGVVMGVVIAIASISILL